MSKVFITVLLILSRTLQWFSIGVAKNYVQNTLDMKKNCTIVILDKLREFQSNCITILLIKPLLGLAAGIPVP